VEPIPFLKALLAGPFFVLGVLEVETVMNKVNETYKR
jgi:hypothetical protein